MSAATCTRKPDAAIGETVAGESHAWVEWFCGDWRGFDPTNLIDIGDRHVTVGRGRDYKDVAPLRGVYAGPYGQQALRDRGDHARGVRLGHAAGQLAVGLGLDDRDLSRREFAVGRAASRTAGAAASGVPASSGRSPRGLRTKKSTAMPPASRPDPSSRHHRPARAERVGDPADDGRPDRSAAEEHRDVERHHPAPHRRARRGLHVGVRGRHHRERREADEHERDPEDPDVRAAGRAAQRRAEAGAAMRSVRSRGRSRRAESSAPVSEPIARTDDSRPNSPAPSSNSTRAIVERKIEKLNPSVPIRNDHRRCTSTMSGRVRT